MELWDTLFCQLENFKSSSSSIRQHLIAYQTRCENIIQKISSKSFDEAQPDFDELYSIQEKLAIVKYKYEFQLDDRLQRFLYHFERDDSYSRRYWYSKFESGMKWPDD